jgi:hypothetical protein
VIAGHGDPFTGKAHFDNFTAPGIPEATAARLYQVMDEK